MESWNEQRRMEHLNKPLENQPLSNKSVDLDFETDASLYFFSFFFPPPFGVLPWIDKEGRNWLPPLTCFHGLLLSLGLFSCCHHFRLGGRCHAMPVVFLLCSVAVSAFLSHVSHPAFSSCLSSALNPDAVAVSGEFPCFISSI